MRISLLTAIASTLLVGATQAQEVAYRINNYSIHKGIKSSGFLIHGAEIGYLKSLNQTFDLYLPLRVGPRGEAKKVVNSETTKYEMMGTFALDMALQAKYDNGKNRIIPFVSAGVGAELYDSGVELGAPVGAGINVRITPKVKATIASNYRLPFNETTPNGFCHSLGVIVNLKGKKKENETPFISKMPEKQPKINEEYARIEAETRAKKEAEAQAEADRKRLAAEQKAKEESDALAKAEAAKQAKMSATVAVEVAPEVKKVLDYALKGVQFETGSAQLTQASYAILDEVALTMYKNLDLRISIEGHTDRTGNESINQKLSEARAKTCMTYLVTKGIKSERLQTKGFGSSKPVSDNETNEGRSLNRRVEFIPF
ncbi:MAG: OmpA family protein [Saprospiraceae bacterium]|nr:OmpA family protein [Saprospiraceae bacterium]